jgi:hypothetical protein
MAEQNGFVGWMGSSKQFFFFRGVSSYSLGKPEVIECKIQEDVFDNIDESQQMKCYAGVNPQFTEIWFSYPDQRDTDGVAECSRIAVVDWTTGTWSSHILARTSWQASGVFPNPLALTPGGRILEHEIGRTANGALIEATLTTSDFDADEGDFLLSWLGIIPDFKDQSGDIMFRVFGKNYPNSELRLLGEFISSPTKTQVNFRLKARQFVLQIVWATAGGWGRMGANRLNIQKTVGRQ